MAPPPRSRSAASMYSAAALDASIHCGLFHAAAEGDLRLFKGLAQVLDDGRGRVREAVEAMKGERGVGALHVAAICGRLELCRYLVEDLRVDVDAADDLGFTPLIFAMNNENVAVFKYLLDHGADKDKVYSDGLAPLHCAAGLGNCEMIELLLAKGAYIDPVADRGTPLHIAALEGQAGAMKILLDHNADVRLVNKELDFPFLGLLISGGHNLLVLAHDLGQYVQLGTTIDDAIGEAYDKSARWLGLDMRKGGGPALEELALEGDPEAVKFRVPMRQHKDCNFSYAGLKTQVRLAIESRCSEDIPISSASEEDRQSRADIAASFQRVAVLHLEERCQRAVEWALKIEPSIKHFVVSGGVASNKYVRTRLTHIAEVNGLQLVTPPPSLCTDNGVMIAWTGIEHFVAGRFENPPAADEPDDMQYELRPRWPLGEEYSEGKSVARSMKTARIHPSLTSMIQGSLQK